MGLALQPLGVVHGRCAVGPQQATIGGDPGVEESSRLERGFKASTLVGVDVLAKINELPQRRAGTLSSRLGAAGVGRQRSGVFALREPVTTTKIGSIGLIVLGVIGLTVGSQRA